VSDPAVRVATATVPAVVGSPSKFMLDPATYAMAGAAGHDGMNFYVAGRGGALGDVAAPVVVEEFGVFAEAMVAAAWEASASVEPRAEAAQRFADAASAWAEANLAADALDYGRLAELAGTVLEQADLSGSALTAGWRELDEPSSAAALALHRLNGLRELRFARHREALAAAGVEPLDAVLVASPFMAPLFGWTDTYPEPDEEVRSRWAAAEADTDVRFAADLAALSVEQLAEFEELCALFAVADG